MKKLKSMKILEKAKIPYKVLEYQSDGQFMEGEEVAKMIGYPPHQVYKTLLVNDQKQHYFVMIPVNQKVDLKAIATYLHVKKVEMSKLHELEQLTGYVRGGCTVLGAKKAYRILLDQSCLLLDSMVFSAGERGVQLLCKCEDFIHLVHPTCLDLVLKCDKEMEIVS